MKKLLLISTLVFSLLLVAGCGKKTETTTTDTTTVDATTQTSTDATKEQCLELMAYAFKVAQLQAL